MSNNVIIKFPVSPGCRGEIVKNLKIQAIIWDYDGTLVDTRYKNMNVTRKIIESIVDIPPGEFYALKSIENYDIANRRSANWRELYRREFNLSEKQTDAAGRLWTAYQLDDDTEVTFYSGIEKVVDNLAGFPHGIVSQNSSSSIARNLEKNNLRSYFKHIVGYEEVDLHKQKPEPDGLLSCIEKLAIAESGTICYIGDHDTDIQCARAANHVLQEKDADIKIISIGACYDSSTEAASWKVQPDYVAHEVEEILEVVETLNFN